MFISSKPKTQNAIMRYQFFQAVAGVGIKRYYNDGKGECHDHASAIERTMQTIKDNWKTDNWHDWRHKHLY